MNHAYYGRRTMGCSDNRFAPMPYNRSMPAPTPCDCQQNTVARTSCEDMVVAMAYVPWQTFGTVFTPEEAFCHGTLFPELDKPFLAGGGCRCG